MPETIITKRCSCCKDFKTLEEFYRSKNGKLGRDSECKTCRSVYAKTEQAKERHRAACKRYARSDRAKELARAAALRYSRTAKGKAKIAAYAKTDKCKDDLVRYQQTAKYKAKLVAYRQSAKCKASRKKSHKRHMKKYPIRNKARSAVRRAVASGRLPRIKTQTCKRCDEQAILYHHWYGYAPEHWLDVIPLCHQCDILAHRRMSLTKSS